MGQHPKIRIRVYSKPRVYNPVETGGGRRMHKSSKFAIGLLLIVGLLALPTVSLAQNQTPATPALAQTTSQDPCAQTPGQPTQTPPATQQPQTTPAASGCPGQTGTTPAAPSTSTSPSTADDTTSPQKTVHPRNSKEDVEAIGNRSVGKGVNFYS